MGDHGYARRQPLVDSEEDGVQRADEERPCSLCQHYKTKLEQQQQHTVRLQREVTRTLRNHHRLYKLASESTGYILSFLCHTGRGNEETAL